MGEKVNHFLQSWADKKKKKKKKKKVPKSTLSSRSIVCNPDNHLRKICQHSATNLVIKYTINKYLQANIQMLAGALN